MKQAGPITNVLGKVANIVSHVRQSLHASELIEDERRLQTANATRWNSQLTMVRSILRIPEAKLQELDCPQLNRYERNILDELSEILTPFETATNLLQGQNSVTASLVVPCVRGTTAQLQKMSAKYRSKLMAALQASFDRRMAPYAEKEVFILATALDPRFKLKWAQGMELERLTSLLTTKATACSHSPAPAPTAASPPAKRPRQAEDFLDFFLESQSAATSTTTASPTSVQMEVQDYLREPSLDRSKDPLAYWSTQDTKYPHLATLAAKYLAVPATSAPVERLFSIGGKIFRPDRCRLSDTVFEQLMFIHSNGHIDK